MKVLYLRRASIVTGALMLAASSTLPAKERSAPVDTGDPTSRLFQLLDDSHGGKLAAFYLLGDTYSGKDANNQPAELQHILMVDYDKTRAFGKLNIHVRTVSKLAPEQVKTYTLRQIYDFGVEDTEKFTKSEPGQLGRVGDLYVALTDDGRIGSAPISDEARKRYDFFLTQYVIPALQKSGDASAALAKHESQGH